MPRLTPHITATPRMAPNAESMPNALEKISEMIDGISLALISTMTSANTM